MSEGQPKSTADLVEEYITQHDPHWTNNTYLAAENELRRFLQFIGGNELTPKLVADYQAAQHLRKCKPYTLYRTIQWTQRFLVWLEDMEYVRHNRVTNILRVPNVVPGKVRCFTHIQYEDLKEVAAGTMWYYAIVMAYRVGTRYSDTAMMKWEYVNLEKRVIRYVPWKTRKTGREANCPFEAGGDLHQVLLELNVSRHAHPMWREYVCPEMAMTYPKHESIAQYAQRYQFKMLCKKIGAETGLTFHSLRHSFISRLIKGGATYPMGSQITGLSTPQMFLRYAEPDVDTLRKAIESMSKNDNPPDEGQIIKLPAA